MKKINFGLIVFFKKIIKGLLNHLFLFFWVLVFFAFAIAGLIFYKYYLSIANLQLQSPDIFIKVETDNYQKVISEWKNREKKSEEADLKEYFDPFREIKKEVVVNEKPAEKEPATLPAVVNLETKNLYDFYRLKGMDLPSIEERAKIWADKGLGKTEDYKGFFYQNLRLLEALQK